MDALVVKKQGKKHVNTVIYVLFRNDDYFSSYYNIKLLHFCVHVFSKLHF